MAENKVFRKVSLDRLSSPEELDQRLTVTSPMGWLACLAIILLAAAGIIWGIFGKIPDKAMGEGIIISSGGVTNVISQVDGHITDVKAQEGDYVKKGDVIARVEQTEIVDKVNQLKEDLEVIKNLDTDNPRTAANKLNLNVYGQIIENIEDMEYARTNLDVQRANLTSAHKSQAINLEQAKWELEQATLQLEKDKDHYEKSKYLFEHAALSQQEFTDAERNFILSEAALQNKKEKLQNLIAEANVLPRSQVLQAEQNLDVLKQKLKDTRLLMEKDLEKQIARMQLELINSSEITADVSGRVVELQVKKGGMLGAGNSVCSIARQEKEAESLTVVIYMPVEQGKKVRPGMAVNISPSTVKKEEDGFMLGNVKSVSEYPASSQGMMLTLGNSELVNRLTGQGSPIEIRVELVRDSNTVSGYKWSTPEGPEMIIDSGTLCLGEVKVSEQRPISMVIPFIKRILPI
ncbi:NHLP bacteriocin system secretion protein [Desulfotomaculum sp. 1211_IL3151]|uniref:NHLP bacteriocin system secretion protein n=1 Tax=Desulfotomaculum sp. 1211_IL3151 TaxID=3084055 RepID=UPI002FD98D52